MNIVITARKTTVKDSFKERVEKKLAKFDRFSLMQALPSL